MTTATTPLCSVCHAEKIEQVNGPPVCVEHGNRNYRGPLEIKWRDPCFTPTKAQALVLLAKRLMAGEAVTSWDVAIENGVSLRTAQRWLAELSEILPITSGGQGWSMATPTAIGGDR